MARPEPARRVAGRAAEDVELGAGDAGQLERPAARDREQQIGGSGGSLEPPGPLLEPPGPLLTHLHTVYMAYSECLPTRLNPLAERTCFHQARCGSSAGTATRATTSTTSGAGLLSWDPLTLASGQGFLVTRVSGVELP